MSDPEEIRAWTEIFGVSVDDLQRAVEAAGNTTLNLREHFGLRRS